MSWKVEGATWTGTIKTVGAGKDYATIAAALVANPAGDILLLVDSGTYTADLSGPSHWNGRKVRIRGQGADYAAVVVTGRLLFTAANAEDIIVENVDMHFSSGFAGQIYQSAGSVNLKISKSRVLNSTANRGIVASAPDANYEPTILFTQCYIDQEQGYYWWYGGDSSHKLDLDHISLNKIRAGSDPFGSYTINALAQNDYVKVDTENYGPAYGDYLIQEEASAPSFKPKIILL